MLKIGDNIKVRVPEVPGYWVEYKPARVIYIHRKYGWFMVEIRGKGGKYRTCFRLPTSERIRTNDGKAILKSDQAFGYAH